MSRSVGQPLQPGIKWWAKLYRINCSCIYVWRLTEHFCLGICGSPKLLDMGGVPNLVPLAKKEKLYDMRSIPPLTGASGGDQLIIGAGAAPWTFKSRNGEVGRQLYL